MNKLVCLLLAIYVLNVSSGNVGNKGGLNSLGKLIALKLDKEALKLNNLNEIDGNAYIDMILDEVHDDIVEQHLDPYKIGETNVSQLHIYGYLGGFSTIHRKGDANVTETSTELYITVDLNIDNLEGDFNWTASYLGLGYHGDADILVDTVDIFLTLQGDIIEGSIEVYLNVTSLDIQNIGRISVEVTGFGLFDQLIDEIADAIEYFIKDLIPTIFDSQIQIIFQNILDNLPVPLPEE